MRSTWRTLQGVNIRDIALVCLADALVGASFGAISVAADLPLWLPVVMSLVVFAGSSQFIFVGILAVGGNPVAAVASALLANTRLVPLGFSIGAVFENVSPLKRLLGTHLITDEAVAFTVVEKDEASRRTAFWLCGIGLFVTWNIGVLIGTLAGGAITDTAALGLDAAFPAILLGLIMPALRDRATRNAALAGAVIALIASMFLPSGLPVLLSLIAVVPAMLSTAPGTQKEPA
ncbi:branched-chain amino acid transporter AzlC [Rhodococcus sp. 06-412-2C]|uniref:AzlC family ABC transporter permease n=1 Tax=unclassified Rhodococcus (in: high G+C Gram-positive bacteria) TaxID=192944 RepID=UPI000B9B1C60|nr:MULTISPECIES: AzlC family ABC transporter permease [unclassified Rhodococcus (in: high G+C Gram-positive bacteria)]OZC88693.1 branched-chain amino acid transporter AzlC [Rhodococcus sp. 06-412-2C]OZD03058.1 branched-chain amino acid transporter AzlC [Rhodococcus sp. 06-412-2B]